MRLWSLQLSCDNSYGCTTHHHANCVGNTHESDSLLSSGHTLSDQGVNPAVRLKSNVSQFRQTCVRTDGDTRADRDESCEITRRIADKLTNTLAHKSFMFLPEAGWIFNAFFKIYRHLGLEWRFFNAFKRRISCPGWSKAEMDVSDTETVPPSPAPAAVHSLSQSRSEAPGPPRSVLDPMLPSRAPVRLGH